MRGAVVVVFGARKPLDVDVWIVLRVASGVSCPDWICSSGSHPARQRHRARDPGSLCVRRPTEGRAITQAPNDDVAWTQAQASYVAGFPYPSRTVLVSYSR